MGVSEASEGGIGAGECGVGTIVWVRRRNGSWWPGRILGQEELSASHLMSPRSGTPVKLLGREDASVDWYNLEKSKRVKAFRCGEFDSCIERAESSQSAPIKKREKYARREDAILHALELEKKNLEKRQQKCDSTINKNFEVTKKEQNVGIFSGNHMKNDESANHSRFAPKPQLLSRNVSSPEAGINNPLYTQNQKGKDGKHSGREDNTPEATPRMRGLQDFGLRSAQSKRKFDVSIANESEQRSFLVDSHGRAFPGSMQGMEGITNVMNSKNYAPFKKRRLQVGLNEEFLNKRRDRRRPLLQVLQSSAKLSTSKSLPSAGVSIPVNPEAETDQDAVTLSNAERSTRDNLPGDPNNCLDHTGYSSDQMQISPVLPRYPCSMNEETTSSGLNEANESGSLGEVHSDEDPDTEDDETLYQGYNQPLPSRSKNPGRFVENNSLITFPDQEKYVNLDGNNKSYLSGFIYPQYPHRTTVGTSASNLEVSKWNMKGKRNIRNMTKRPMDEMSGHMYHSSMNGRPYQSKRLVMKSSRGRAIAEGFYQKHDNFNGSEFIEKDLSPQMPRYSNNRLMLKGSFGDQRDGGIIDSDEESPGISPYGWEVDGDRFDQYYAGGMDFLCVDVDLKVQTSYQGERVPLVSLMSRLDGKAIVGHPLPIETLEDGSTNALITRNDSGEDPASSDGNETPPPVWTTGRRTAMQRVPRPHPLPAALESKDADDLLYSDPEMKPTFKKPYDVHLDNQTIFRKKTSSNSHRPVRYQKKPSKKASLSSNQKIRKLSSFASQQKLGKFPSSKVRGILDGLIKPEGLVPIVACVPVKVLFSRILEAVGRSSSISTSHRGSLPVSLENKPS